MNTTNNTASAEKLADTPANAYEPTEDKTNPTPQQSKKAWMDEDESDEEGEFGLDPSQTEARKERKERREDDDGKPE